MPAVVGMLALAGALLTSAYAQTPAAPAQPESRPATDGAQQRIPVEITGFRSARFGMTEEQVRGAIKSDFNLAGKDIRDGANELEKTRFLAVQVDDLVPGSGRAVVTYIFGFSSHRLIQVNLVWGKRAGQNADPAELTSTGRILQQYFLGQGFVRDTVVVNRQLRDGTVVLFNGYDTRKRSVLMILDVTAVPKEQAAEPPDSKTAAGAKAARPKTPGKTAAKPETQLIASSLRLAYMESAANPDIYRVQKGKF